MTLKIKHRDSLVRCRALSTKATSGSKFAVNRPGVSVFIRRFLTFIGLIVPSAFALALLATPAKPTRVSPTFRTAMLGPVRDGCEHMLMEAVGRVATMQARLKNFSDAHGPDFCHDTRLYFLEEVKERAVTAVCTTGIERERQLGRLDAGVEQANDAIAANCTN
jgi:hypothetical protein